ncbi:hypothetical protein Droror1_Dr00027555 [Drosera rotundifolia]
MEIKQITCCRALEDLEKEFVTLAILVELKEDVLLNNEIEVDYMLKEIDKMKMLMDRSKFVEETKFGRLRAAFEENGGKPKANPFGARAVRLYLREVRDLQSKVRGISYEKMKRKHHHHHAQTRQPPPPPSPSLRNIPAVLPPPGASF